MTDTPNTLPSARQCATELLEQALDFRRSCDEAFIHHKGLATLSERDRNFARLLVLTTLRRLGQIDKLLAKLLEKPLTGKSSHVMHCLRLGITQLFWLDTPPHAAVHAMVETAAALGYDKMKGLVNAVLKRASREGKAILAAQDEATANLPDWLYASWKKAYGEPTAHAIATARLQEPPLDITVKSDPTGWAEKLGGVVLPSGSVRIENAGKIELLPGYDEGAWWVQDAAAALPVQLLGDVRGKTVLDLCAAPGGKTAQLAAAGANVIAVDKAPARLKRLEQNMARLGLSVQTIEAEILIWKPDFTPDAIVLDAPCSATGTLRRNPEVVWHRTPEDIAKLAALQRKLLSRVAGWLKPGGMLVYCVCSLEPEEGENQAKNFLEQHPEFMQNLCIKPPVEASQTGSIRTHPALWGEQKGCDGFYANCWVRLSIP